MSFNSSMLDKPLQNPLVSHGGLMYTKPQDGEPRLNKTVAEDLPPRDETDPSSIGPKLKPVQRQHWGHFWERRWSAHGLIPVCVDGHVKCLTLKSSTGVSRNLALMDVPAQLISTVTGPCSSSIYTNTVLHSLTGSGRNHSTPIHKKHRERVRTGEPPHIVHLTYLSLKKQSYSVSGKEPLNRQIISPCCLVVIPHWTTAYVPVRFSVLSYPVTPPLDSRGIYNSMHLHPSTYHIHFPTMTSSVLFSSCCLYLKYKAL